MTPAPTEAPPVATEQEQAVDLSRLRKAMEAADKQLEEPRRLRVEMLKQIVGSNYATGGAKEEVPINMLRLALEIALRLLVPSIPRAMCTTKWKQCKAAAHKLEMDINLVMSDRNMRFRNKIRSAVMDAWMSIGIMKTCLSDDGGSGAIIIEPIHLDDWVHDATAKRWEDCSFMGHRYRMRLDVAKKNPDFDPAAASALTAAKLTDTNSKESADQIKGDPGAASFVDYCELWDIYLPFENVVVTFQDKSGNILKTTPWEGPKSITGPFRILGFLDIADNVMPAAPGQMLMDLHVLINALWNKLALQGQRQKEVIGVMEGGDREGKNVQSSSDGEVVSMPDPSKINKFRSGGPDQANMALTIQAKSEFNIVAGNLEAMGGLSPQSDTAAQDKLLQGSVAKQIQEQQDRVYEFVGDIINDVGFYRFHDPLLEQTLALQPQGVDFGVPVRLTRDDIPGTFQEYGFTISPYSMTEESPQSKLQTLMGVLQSIVIPMAPQLAQSGLEVSLPNVLQTIGRYANLEEELADIIVPTMTAPQGPPPGQGDGPGMPANTTRTNVRVSRPGATRQGQDATMVGVLSGKNNQDAEKAGIGRSIG